MERRYSFNFCSFLIFVALLLSCKPKHKENNDTVLQGTETVSKPGAADSIPHADTAKIIDVTAITLAGEYVANEVKADNDYKGKQIVVTGEITDIKKGIADDIYVVLKGSEKYRSVQCYYKDEKDAQTLKKGMQVSFRGKCDGLWVNVILSDCERIR